MNLHPIFVHFPIALLTWYTILEVIPFERWYPRVAWESIKTFLIVAGELGAILALLTGLSQNNFITDPIARRIVELHEAFAYATLAVFGILALAYLIRWIAREHGRLGGAVGIAGFVLKRWVRTVLALAGLAAVTVTGALGGIIVYGPDVDPVAKFIYVIFFK